MTECAERLSTGKFRHYAGVPASFRLLFRQSRHEPRRTNRDITKITNVRRILTKNEPAVLMREHFALLFEQILLAREHFALLREPPVLAHQPAVPAREHGGAAHQHAGVTREPAGIRREPPMLAFWSTGVMFAAACGAGGHAVTVE